MLDGELFDAKFGLAELALQLQTHIGTAKVSPKISGEDFAKRKARIYGVGEASAEIRCVPPVDVDVERFRRRSRTGLLRLLSVGSWLLGLPRVRLFRSFARTPQGARHGQNADVFFHSVNWKRHIG